MYLFIYVSSPGAQDKQAVNVRQIKKHQDSDSSDDEKKKQNSQDVPDESIEESHSPSNPQVKVPSDKTSPNPIDQTTDLNNNQPSHQQHQLHHQHPRSHHQNPHQQQHHQQRPHHHNQHYQQKPNNFKDSPEHFHKVFEDRLILCSSINEELHSKKPHKITPKPGENYRRISRTPHYPNPNPLSKTSSRDSLKHEMGLHMMHKYEKNQDSLDHHKNTYNKNPNNPHPNIPYSKNPNPNSTHPINPHPNNHHPPSTDKPYQTDSALYNRHHRSPYRNHGTRKCINKIPYPPDSTHAQHSDPIDQPTNPTSSHLSTHPSTHPSPHHSNYPTSYPNHHRHHPRDAGYPAFVPISKRPRGRHASVLSLNRLISRNAIKTPSNYN